MASVLPHLQSELQCKCGWRIHCGPRTKSRTIVCPQCTSAITLPTPPNTPPKTPPTKPGLWVRILQRLSRPEDVGLGATVKRIAAQVGGERFKRWSKRIGLPCGCTEREEEWNKKYPNPNHQT